MLNTVVSMLPLLILVGVGAAIAVHAHKRKRPGEKPVGIIGWLAFLAIGIVLGPIFKAYEVSKLVKLMLELPTEHPFRGGVHLLFVLALGITLYAVGVAVMFFRKKRAAPRLLIGLMVAQICYVVCAALLIMLAWKVPLRSQDVTFNAINIVVGVAWIAYLLRSERVRNTFVR